MRVVGPFVAGSALLAALCLLLPACGDNDDVSGAMDDETFSPFTGRVARGDFPAQAGVTHGDKILYVRDEVGLTWDDSVHFDIWTMNPDGTNARNLTNREGYDGGAVWSPDGSRILFRSDRAGAGGVYIMDADGGNVEVAVADHGFFLGFAQSPTLDLIAYAFGRSQGGQQLYVSPLGAGATTPAARVSGQAGSVAWSPDGRWVAFHAGGALYKARPDGRDLMELAHGTGPAWSPDGGRIVFTYRDNTTRGPQDVYAIDADGSNERRLTDSRSEDIAVAWFPDGQRILFVSSRDGNRDVFVMRDDGSAPRNLTNHPAGNATFGHPSLSADGTAVVFDSMRGGGYDVYRVEVDGSGLTRLTDCSLLSAAPQWRPRRAKRLR